MLSLKYLFLLHLLVFEVATQHGEPKQIFESGEGNELNLEALNSVLGNSLIKDRKVVVISIAGPFRRGKSFFMNYCLRFMYANYKSVNFPRNSLNNPTNWMGDQNDRLSGFSWKSGSIRDTFGVMLWSDVFIHTNEAGENLAIVLMDSQGLFDSHASSADNSKILALSTLLSSTQIFNINGVIQEDQLQYLQLITDFAKLASSSNRNKAPFQNLLFLIRDWNYPEDHQFGREGGDEYVNKILNIADKKNEALRAVRKHIYESFESVNGVLLPLPGINVAKGVMMNSQKYDGRWSEMDIEFKDELKAAIEGILKPKNLKIKKVNGRDITCQQLSTYTQMYLEMFSKSKLPEVQTIYQATVETFMKVLISGLAGLFEKKLRGSINIYDSNLAINFDDKENALKAETLADYNKAKKMGSSNTASQFREELATKINKAAKTIRMKALSDHFKDLETKHKQLVENYPGDRMEKELLRELLSIELLNKKLYGLRADMEQNLYDLIFKALQFSLKDNQARAAKHHKATFRTLTRTYTDRLNSIKNSKLLK